MREGGWDIRREWRASGSCGLQYSKIAQVIHLDLASQQNFATAIVRKLFPVHNPFSDSTRAGPSNGRWLAGFVFFRAARQPEFEFEEPSIRVMSG
jgi:hypothetical protein